MITQSQSYEQPVFNDWRKAEIIYILLKQFFRLDVQRSRGGSLLRGFAFFSLTQHWTNSLVKHQHTLRNKFSRGNGRIHHLKQPLKYNAHVSCQHRHSRNVLIKALRNIHCHCSTGFMESEVLHLRHSLQETIYPYKDLEKSKQKNREQHFIKALSKHQQ